MTWSPWGRDGQSNGVTIDDFDDTPDGQKILRYSIEMKVTETSTTSRAKVWSSDKLRRRTKRAVAFFSNPVSQEPIFGRQYVSSSMAQSFDFESRKKEPRGVAPVIRRPSMRPSLDSQTSELPDPEQRPGAHGSLLKNTANADKSQNSFVRPTQRQGTSGGPRYILGSPRNNGGKSF